MTKFIGAVRQSITLDEAAFVSFHVHVYGVRVCMHGLPPFSISLMLYIFHHLLLFPPYYGSIGRRGTSSCTSTIRGKKQREKELEVAVVATAEEATIPSKADSEAVL